MPRRLQRDGVGGTEGDLICSKRIDGGGWQGGQGEALVDIGLAHREGECDVRHARALRMHLTAGADFVRWVQAFWGHNLGLGPCRGLLGDMGRGRSIRLVGNFLQLPTMILTLPFLRWKPARF